MRTAWCSSTLIRRQNPHCHPGETLIVTPQLTPHCPAHTRTMRVFVATATGGTIVVPACSADTTVDEFEAAVDARCSGIEDARLVHGCKQLARGRTLRDYNVQEGSTVQQLLRLRGGGVRRHAPPIHPLSFPTSGLAAGARGGIRRGGGAPSLPLCLLQGGGSTAPHEPRQCTVTHGAAAVRRFS